MQIFFLKTYRFLESYDHEQCQKLESAAIKFNQPSKFLTTQPQQIYAMEKLNTHTHR